MSAHGGGIPEEHEEHENHERWLVTYADMVTLLMVLFIVMFAMSQVDERKFMELKNGLAAGFAHSSSILPGSDTLLEQNGTSAMSPIAPEMVQQTGAGNGAGTVEQIARRVRTAQAATQLKAMQEVSGLRELQAEVAAALAAQGLGDDVQTSIDDRGLVISLVSKHVTFRSGQATLSPRGELVVDTLGPVLAKLPQDLEVSGHTNQVPGRPAAFATDWDLSAARAVTVLRRLNEVLGIPADRLSVAAYGNTRPLMDPAERGSQAVNKRVDLVLLSESDEATRKLVDRLASGEPARPDAGTEPATTVPTVPTASTPDLGSDDLSAGASLDSQERTP